METGPNIWIIERFTYEKDIFISVKRVTYQADSPYKLGTKPDTLVNIENIKYHPNGQISEIETVIFSTNKELKGGEDWQLYKFDVYGNVIFVQSGFTVKRIIGKKWKITQAVSPK
jgi:hypothetical protein